MNPLFKTGAPKTPSKPVAVDDSGIVALRHLSGTPEGIKKAIDASKLGQHWKSAIASEIDADQLTGAIADIHYFREPKAGVVSLHITIAPKTILT